MNKKITGLLLASFMAVTMMACGSSGNGVKANSDTTVKPAADSAKSEAKETEGETDVTKLQVGIVMKSSDEFQNSVVQGARDAAIEAGVPEDSIKNVASTSESDAYQQVTAIEDMISNGVNILLVSCQEENALQNCLQSAIDKGIAVVMVDTDNSLINGKVTFIGTDNETAAYDGAKIFAERLDEGANVVILRGKLGDVNHDARTTGLEKALEEEGMNVLEVQDANCETDKAANVMESFISKYNDIDAVMVTSDSMAVGAAQAIKNAGVSGIKVCGFDGFQAAISLIPSGEVEMIIGQKPYSMGYDGFYDGLGYLNGETYEPYYDPGIQVIDEDNYQDFISE